jgi:ABC-type dipeptide/oligopeptide/nickel transport system permease component
MGQQIVHRLLISFPALLGVLFLCFCLLQVVPADPAMIIAGPDAKAETIAAIRLELGLDRSIPVQFFEYILRVLRGDLGRSIISNREVSEELAMTIGPTVELMVGSMLLAVPLGLTLARWRRSIAAASPIASSWRARWRACRCRCSSSA